MAEIQKMQDRLSGAAYPPVPPNWGAAFTKTTRFDTYAYIDPTKRSNCSGKAVLVTGGNKGIGFGVALSYAKAGASHIAITSRSKVASAVTEEIRKAAADAGRDAVPEVLALTMDVTDSASVKKAALDVETHFGRLDILICNAGFLARYDKILDSDEDEWWRSFDVNLRGGYLVAKAFLPLMLSKGGDKTIVTMSSTGALHFHQGGSSYQISKFALLRLMEFIMAEYADQGFLVYSVHPGGVATDLASRLPQETQTWLKCTPALSGDTIAFLTSERQEWLAGRYLTAMWDMNEFFAKKQEIIDRDLLKMRLTF
ncbi:NAD(P)-binding protein [Xylaria longipes]|nr:NAD(P)-binding protein [Xylaria longipes]